MFHFFGKRFALFSAIAIIVTGSIGILSLWHTWPQSHLLIFERALDDVQNLREKQDGTYHNQYRDDLPRLGAFGDIYGSLTSLFASLAFIASGSALLIQIYLFYDQKLHQTKLDKQQRTFMFYDDFNSSEMFRVRIEAELYLKNTQMNLYEIAEKCSYDHEDRGKGAGAIWPIMRFYQKLAKAREYSQLDNEMTVDLFAEVFIWWYFAYFEDKLVKAPSESDIYWDVANDLTKFQEWLEGQCKDGENKARYDRWEKAASLYKDRLNARNINDNTIASV